VTPGQLLREARQRHYATQKQLAARAGTSQAAISRIERDQVSPTVETLARLLDLLGEELVLRTQEIDWGHDRTLNQSNLDRTPAQRIADSVAYARFAADIQAARAG
jgi:transcriptional regulator with XRE-family HTH domain